MKSKEELKAGAFEHIDTLCKEIAQTRRISEIEGINVEEIDNHMNECCTKWAKRYNDMDPIEIALEGMKEIVEAGMGDKLIEDILKGMREGDD